MNMRVLTMAAAAVRTYQQSWVESHKSRVLMLHVLFSSVRL